MGYVNVGSLMGFLLFVGCSAGSTGTGVVGESAASDGGTTGPSTGGTVEDANAPRPADRDTGAPTGDDGMVTNSEVDAQRPPTNGKALEVWLAAGSYKSWHCEATKHPARSPGAHGQNRICSNDLLSAHGAGEFPVDSAGVKELYSGDTIIGYAVYRHVRAGTTADTWYWYERSGTNEFADGTGGSGAAKSVCVDCHASAGTGPGLSGHDFVFTQVK